MDITARLARHARWVLAAAALVVALAVVAGGGVEEHLSSGGTTDPNSDSDLVAQAVEESAPAMAPNLVVILDTPGGAESDEALGAAQRIVDRLAEETEVVVSYADERPDLVATDDQSALVTARLPGDEAALAETLDRLEPALEDAAGPVEVEFAGTAVVRAAIDSTISSDLVRAELIALPITFVLLLLVFGGFTAAVMPLLVGVFAILTTNAVLRGITEFTDVSTFALNLTTALGLGLSIDYALLIVRRYREEIAESGDHSASLHRTMRTAGRTVAFSGITVAVAMSALLVFPLYFLRSFAYAGISVVLAAMVGALIITPAAITLFRKQLSRPSRFRLRSRTPGRHGPADPANGRWARTAGWVNDHARWVAPASVLVMLALALPFANVEFGTSDYRQLPSDSPVRLATERLADDFGQAQESFAVIEVADAASAEPLAADIADITGVTGTTLVPTDDGRELIAVTSTLDPRSSEARDLVHEIRSEAGSEPVGGATASLIDTEQAVGDRLPLAVGLVVVSALLLIFLLSGSILLPVVTLLTNALSLTAMFGAIVWVFQEGHLADLLGFTPTGFVDVALPALMACVAMALSLDYGVFVVARLVEEHRSGDDMRTVLSRSLQRTGGVVTAAALILSTVLIAIGTSSITNTKMLGLGVALAVLVDATVVRAVIVPSVLALLGRATWWAPAPLRRFHTRWGWREDGDEAPAPARPLTTAGAPTAPVD